MMSSVGAQTREVTFQYTLDELIDASRLSLNAMMKRRKWYFILFAVFFVPAVVATLLFDAHWTSNKPFLITLVIVVLLPLLNYFVLVPISCRRQAAMDKALLNPQTWRWNAEKFEIIASNGHAFYDWQDLFEMHENDRVMIVLPRPRVMFIAPKRALDEGQLASLPSLFAASRQQH